MVNYTIYSITAMVLFGVAAFLRKIGMKEGNQAVMFTVVEGIFLTLTSGLLFLIMKGQQMPDFKIPVVTGVLSAVGLVLFFTALSSGPLSIVAAIVNSNTLIAVLAGILVLNESLTLVKGLGIGFAIIGILLMSL
ncbi:MAG TPA: hypothetical protein ENN60_03510 [archaeon]|nr:hypothetical protein [archaeon]